MNAKIIDNIKNSISAYRDYPKEGIVFRDINSLINDPVVFKDTINLFVEHYKDHGFTKIVATEARGFIFGAPLAVKLNAGLVLVRKPNKLPGKTITETYALEYGSDSLSIQENVINANDNVLLIDDLLATGGTAEATINLVRRQGAKIDHAGFVINLPDLPGEKRLKDLGISSYSLVNF